MCTKIQLLCLFTIIAIAAGRVVREAPENVQDNAIDFGKIVDDVKNVFNSINTDELQQKALSFFQAFSDNTQQQAQVVKEKFENLPNDPNVQNLETKVKSFIEDLGKEHPDTAEGIQSFLNRVTEGGKALLEKTKEIENSEGTQELKKSVGELGEQVTKSLQELRAKLLAETNKQS